METVEKYLGRDVIKVETVSVEGTFQSFYTAEAKLREMGYVIGSMCGGEPIGFADGEQYNYISKWHNLNPGDVNYLDGVMISNDWREGSVDIIWFKEPK
jgi:hypothetical protein